MAQSIYDKYLEAEVLGADPLKLVRMLYRGAIEAVGAARRHLEAGEICQRSRQIVRAWEILQELSRSLDHAQAPEISRTLAELYTYMQVRLMEANTEQIDAPLAEVERLLSTVFEGWNAAAPARAASVASYEPVSCAL